MFWKNEEEKFPEHLLLKMKVEGKKAEETKEGNELEDIKKKIEFIDEKLEFVYRYVTFLSDKIESVRRELLEKATKERKVEETGVEEALEGLERRIRDLRRRVESLKTPEVEIEETSGSRGG